LFDRIILDEAQENRNCETSNRGVVLRMFNARLRWIFTGTIFQKSLHDIWSHIAFLERPWWSGDYDRNSAYAKQMMSDGEIALGGKKPDDTVVFAREDGYE